MTLRTDVDYGDFEYIEKNEADGALRQAKRFLKIIDSVRKKLIKKNYISFNKFRTVKLPASLPQPAPPAWKRRGWK